MISEQTGKPQDLSDIVAIVRPFETPLLDVLMVDSSGQPTQEMNFAERFESEIRVSKSGHPELADEIDYQAMDRLRELLRALENSVVNGVESAELAEGSQDILLRMNGLLSMLKTNSFEPGVGEIPQGTGPGSDELTEEMLNASIQKIKDRSSSVIDLIVVSGPQKRRINSFSGGATPVFKSDLGVAQVVLSRFAPADTVIMLDSSRVNVFPIAGRRFAYESSASTHEEVAGRVFGEYTLELIDENAHGVLTGLAS